MACDLIATIKVFQVILCICCLSFNLWTEFKTLRVFYQLEKQSREWPLTRRITLDRTSAIFTDIVLGSYVIITIGLLIGHIKGELNKARSTEGFFLVLGTILFLIVGGLCLTSVDDVPHQLVDNNIILGILTIVTAILFLLDIGLTRKQPGYKETNKAKQQPIKREISKPIVNNGTSAEKVDETEKKGKKKSSMFQDLKSSLKKKSADEPDSRDAAERTVEFQDREVHEDRPPRENGGPGPSAPHQVGRRNMENRGFSTNSQERRTVDPEEFERSFKKVQETAPNGFIRSEDRQSAFNQRDDERYRKEPDPDYPNYPDHPRREEYQQRREPNGYIRREDREFYRELLRQPSSPEYTQSPPELLRQPSSPKYAQYSPEFYGKERRHSIDYMEKQHPREYQRNEDRRQEYAEDSRSYKGYTETVKYLERTSAEKQRRFEDTAMPPKHVIEVEMDDHYYKGEPQVSTRKENRETLQVAKVSSSQKQENNGSSDDSELIPQIPSVSFLLSERGRKVMPSLSPSPVKRVSSPPSKYYFADPSSPGFVKQTASHWPSPSPVGQHSQSPGSRSAP